MWLVVVEVVGGEAIVAAFASVTGEGDIGSVIVDMAASVGCVGFFSWIWLAVAALLTIMVNTGP